MSAKIRKNPDFIHPARTGAERIADAPDPQLLNFRFGAMPAT
jgi:hypothetical protein